MSVDWAEEVNANAKKARDEGRSLLNEDGIKTDAQDPTYLYDYPWLEFDKDSRIKKNTVSSITINDYTKSVLDELKKRTGVSDRKRITLIVEAGLAELAKDIENNRPV